MIDDFLTVRPQVFNETQRHFAARTAGTPDGSIVHSCIGPLFFQHLLVSLLIKSHQHYLSVSLQ
jgi:hypothetical protein